MEDVADRSLRGPSVYGTQNVFDIFHRFYDYYGVFLLAIMNFFPIVCKLRCHEVAQFSPRGLERMEFVQL